jgi:hypothetical protein
MFTSGWRGCFDALLFRWEIRAMLLTRGPTPHIGHKEMSEERGYGGEARVRRQTLVVGLLITVAVSGGACTTSRTFSGAAGGSTGERDVPEPMSGAGGGNHAGSTAAGTASSEAGSTGLGGGAQAGDGGAPDAGPQPAIWDTSNWDDGSYFAP